MLKFWQQHRGWVTFVLALVAPLVVVVILVPFRSIFTNAAAAVILIAVVLAVAILGSRLRGYVASLSTALWFDFFQTQIIERAQPMLIQLLDLRSCRFDPMPSDPPMARILSDGSVVHVGMHWPVTQMGIPGPETEIVTEWRGRALGRFVLTPTPGEPVTRERRVVAALLASVVAAALDHETRFA